MSKKTELQKLFKNVAYYAKNTAIASKNRNLDLYNFHYSKASSIYSEIEYLLGSRESEFYAKVEAKTSLYLCSEDAMDSYMDNMNFIEFKRCIGVSERASLQVIDEMF